MLVTHLKSFGGYLLQGEDPDLEPHLLDTAWPGPGLVTTSLTLT